ncbi:hypothetical protein UT300012_24130 [Paraclostridium bifermentans]
MTDKKELLCKLRGHLAFKKQVKPYVIFKDVELERLLEVQPTTLEELATIKGFPRDGKRVTGFGKSIIDIFTRTDKIEDFSVKLDKDGDPVSETKLKRMSLF